jgi:hypothetical protein
LGKNKKSHTQKVAAEMDDEIAFLLAKSLKLVTSGSIELHAFNKPALKIPSRKY